MSGERERDAAVARLWGVLMGEVRAVLQRWEGLPRNVALLVPVGFPPMPGGSRYGLELVLCSGEGSDVTMTRVLLPIVLTGAVAAPTLGERVPSPPWDPDHQAGDPVPLPGYDLYPTPWTVAAWPLVGSGLPEPSLTGYAVRDGRGMPVLETSSLAVAHHVVEAVNASVAAWSDAPTWQRSGALLQPVAEDQIPVGWSPSVVLAGSVGAAERLERELNARAAEAMPVVRAVQRRSDDLVAELRKQVAALERQLAEARSRAAP